MDARCPSASLDLRLLPGESGFALVFPGLAGKMSGSGGGSLIADCGVDDVAATAAAGIGAGSRLLGPAKDGSDRNGTVGSKGSIGEYCVPASTPACFFALDCDGVLRASAWGDCDRECRDGRRVGRGVITLGDW